jgi:hypothetical protein
MHRSYLFAPGHNAKLLGKVFDASADAVMLDLEDAVPAHHKDTARAMVADVLAERDGWVRINPVRTTACEADLDAIAGLAAGIRVPKVESADDAQWVADRAPGTALICAIESARGVLAAAEIASVPGVRHLSMGGVDLRRDLNAGDGNLQTLYTRSHLVVVSRAAGLEPPIDSVYPLLDDEPGSASRRHSPAHSASSANRRSTPASCPSSTRPSPPPSTNSHGRGRSSMPSTAPRATPCNCGPASSSTCLWAQRARRMLELAASLTRQ